MSDIINPYIAGNPVTGSEMFFGREDVFEFVRQTLIGQHHDNIIVLYGQRRTGKTSVLYQMHSHLDPRYLCIFIDLHGFELESLRGFLWELANHIRRVLRRDYQINLPSLNRADFMIDPLTSFEDEFLGYLWSAIDSRHVLLMLDEVVRLQEQVRAGKLGREIFEYMRHLMQHYEQLNFLFSLGSGLEEMQEDYAFLFNIALYKKLSFLDLNAATALITQPVKDYYAFEHAAVEQIMRVTSCHPYFIQLLCHCLFNRWRQQRVSPITAQDVDDVLDETVERGLAVLKHIWEESTAGEKAIMVGIAEIAEELDRPVEMNMIIQTWATYDVTLPQGEIAKATRNLIARDVIGGQGRYIFTVDLQRLWVRKYRRLEWAKEEIAETVQDWVPAVARSKPPSLWERWRVPLQILGIGLILLVTFKLLIPSSTGVPSVVGVPTGGIQTTADNKIAQQIYKETLKRKPTFAFLRNEQDSSFWARGGISTGTCNFTNSAYHVYVNVTKSSHNLTYCFPKGYTFDNFVFQVQMTTLRGNGGGIIFRANTTEAKWYFFAIQSGRSYVLYAYRGLGSSGYNVTTLHGDFNPTISSKMNELTVIAKNQTIYLLVNRQYLWKQVDNTYSSGNIGFLVADSQNLTDIAFTSVEVWQI